MPRRFVPPTHRRFGKAMRQNLTEAELSLWVWLRKPGIAGLRFRRQAPVGLYIADFFCPQHRLIVEVDCGHHSSNEEAQRDRDRDAWLIEQGYRIVRVWNNDVLSNIDGVCAAIAAAVSDNVTEEPPSRNR